MKTKIFFFFSLSIIYSFLLLNGCTNKKVAEQIPSISNGFFDIVEPFKTPDKITTGYVFDTAGSPLWIGGEMYFTNNNFDEPEKSAVIKMDLSLNYIVLRQNNGVTTTMRPSGRGTIYCCEMLGHRVIEMDMSGNIIRVVCDKYNEKRIDGPNDLIVDLKGGIYFTDSQFPPKDLSQDKPSVYYVKPDSGVVRVIDDIPFPNGIALSPDNKILYVANTNGRFLRSYDVNSDGTVTNGRDFAELRISKENIDNKSNKSGADGVVVDSLGNIYVATTQGFGIQVFNKLGKYLGDIRCSSITNNCSFGGRESKTLYISAKDGIYCIDLKVKGK